MKHRSLKARLVLSLTLTCVFGMALAGFISYQQIAGLVYSQTETDLRHWLDATEAAVRIGYEGAVERQKDFSLRMRGTFMPRLRFDSARPIVHHVEDQVSHEKFNVPVATLMVDGHDAENHGLVDQVTNTVGGVATIFAVTPQGMVRLSTSVRRKDGSRAIDTLIPTASPVYQSIHEGTAYYNRAFVVDDWYIVAYEPIFQNDKVVGAFFTGARDTSGPKLREYLKSLKLMQTGYFYILDSTGKMLAHPTLEGQVVADQKDYDGNPLFAPILKMTSGKIEYRWKNAQTGQVQNKLGYVQYFPSLDWRVVASLNLAEVKAEAYRLRTILALVMGGVFFGMLLLSMWIGGRTENLFRPIVERLRGATADVDGYSFQLAEQATELSNSSNHQASALQETVAAVEELNATVHKNLDAARDSAKVAAETQDAAHDGFATFEKLDQAVHSVNARNATARDEINRSYQQISEITSVIQTIEETTTAIHDIVFQTKLLSFNASVEAARAGEHGKGFAVVAEEVGNLASLAGASAKKIQQSVNESFARVRKIIDTSTASMTTVFEASTAEIDQCVEISKLCVSSLRKIVVNVSATNESVGGIAVSSEEQVRAIEQIAVALRQIDQATHVNSNLAQSTLDESKELRAQAQTLRDVMAQLELVMHGGESHGADEAPETDVPHSPPGHRKAA